MNNTALGSQTWVFDDNNNNVPYTDTSIQYPTKPISDEQSFRGSVNSNTYLPQTYNTYSTTQSVNTYSSAITQPAVVNNNKSDGSFVENHPMLTGIGAGGLLLGLTTIDLLLFDDDDDYCRKHHSYSSCKRSRHHSHRYHARH